MAEDWASHVKKYVPDADDGIIAGIVRYCGIALRNRDSSMVAFTDPKETGRVRDNFLKKKLGLDHADDVLDAAIAAVGQRLKGDSTKNRVTVYYLLAENYGLLGIFTKGGASAKAAAPKPTDKDAGGAALGIAALGGAAAAGAAASTAAVPTSPAPVAPPAPAPVAPPAPASVAAPAPAPVAAPAPAPVAAPAPAPVAPAVPVAAEATAPMAAYNDPPASDYGGGGAAGAVDADSGCMRYLLWALLALAALALIWWLFIRPTDNTTVTGGTDVGSPVVEGDINASGAAAADGSASGAANAGAIDLAAAPAEGSVAIPTGAGVTSELRDGKPVVKVYFDSGKTEVAGAFTGTAAGLKNWLDANPGSMLAVSGYNDPSGNAAMNAELSKHRAQAVAADLAKAGIAQASIDLVKPQASTDANVPKEAARRVEVTVK